MKREHRPFLTGTLLFAIFLCFLVSCKQSPEVPRLHPEWSYNATIYEVNVRQFTPEGTFRALENHLPRLQQMGIKILWLMPVNPIGVLNRKGSLGSYYSVQDYLKVNPEFGTEEDFRHLVDRIHELGMYVIIDWVANHTSWDNPLISAHPEWYKKDSAGRIIPPVPDWSDVAGLDYRQEGLRQYMTDALVYWVKKFGIDGYRCDVAGMLPVDFWNKAVPEIRQIKEVFMLAEWESPDMHDTAFDATYSWDLYNLMNRIALGEQTPDRIDTLLNKEMKSYPPYAFRMRFTSNHDENSWNGTEFERLGEGVKAFAVLTFTFPGIPLIYTGQESSMDKRLSFFEKDTVPWLGYAYTGFYSKLVKLRLDHPVLDAGEAGGHFRRITTTNEKAVYAYIRENEEDRVLVVLNLSPVEQKVQMKEFDFQGEYTEVFTGNEHELNTGTSLLLGPWGFRVYVKK